jgi:hypothetical protein
MLGARRGGRQEEDRAELLVAVELPEATRAVEPDVLLHLLP